MYPQIYLDKVEEALFEANKSNLEPFTKLLKVLDKPYSDQKNMKEYQNPNLEYKF